MLNRSLGIFSYFCAKIPAFGNTQTDIYSYQGKELISHYNLIKNEWNLNTLPSVFIEHFREKQLEEKNKLKNIIDRGNITYKEINNLYKDKIDVILTNLENILLKLEQENRRGFRR